MLRARQLIPALTLRDKQGHSVQAWDYKSKKNLVIAFLDADCPECRTFVSSLAERAAELEEKEAVVLLAFREAPNAALGALPPTFLSGVTTNSCGAREFLGNDAVSNGTCGVFVTDRYGEVLGQWSVTQHEFPPIERILSSLNLAEIACEECGVSEWPVDE